MGGILWLIIIIAGVMFFYHPKYEGKTAEEWFSDYRYYEYQYRQLKECVEMHRAGDAGSCL